MLGAGRLHRYTYGDYVALEPVSLTKHEFPEVKSAAMAGSSEEHQRAAEVLRALGNAMETDLVAFTLGPSPLYRVRWSGDLSRWRCHLRPLDQHGPSPTRRH